jgi:hypothetical protein
MAHVSGPRQVVAGVGPTGGPDAGSFRDLVAADRMTAAVTPAALSLSCGMFPAIWPRCAQDRAGGSRSSPIRGSVRLRLPADPARLGLGMRALSQLPDASTNCPSLPTRRVASSTLAW